MKPKVFITPGSLVLLKPNWISEIEKSVSIVTDWTASDFIIFYGDKDWWRYRREFRSVYTEKGFIEITDGHTEPQVNPNIPRIDYHQLPALLTQITRAGLFEQKQPQSETTS